MPAFVRYRDAAGRSGSGAFHGDHVVRLSGPPWDPRSLPVGEVAVADIDLLAPTEPTKVVCVGLSYEQHAVEVDLALPHAPLFFLKAPSAITGPADVIRYPTWHTTAVEHEAELAVVVGERLTVASPDAARRAIFGFTVANDVTARDLQRRDGQWARSKSFDTFCPLGPAVVTDVDWRDLRVRCWVDDELRQDGSTRDLRYDLGELLSYISHHMTLEPGDVILTGSPSGSGPLQPGQLVTAEIEDVGRLRNLVVRDDRPVCQVPTVRAPARAAEVG